VAFNLGSRKGIRPVKNWVVGYWHGYLSGARCRVAYSPADTTVTHRLFASVKSRLVSPLWYRLTRVVPEKRAVKRVCVCVWHLKQCRKACIKDMHEKQVSIQPPTWAVNTTLPTFAWAGCSAANPLATIAVVDWRDRRTDKQTVL